MSKTIIWIEDDIEIIDPVVRPLERAGYQVVRLNTVQEVLGAIEKIRAADLVLLDMILRPGMEEHTFGRYPGLDILGLFREKYAIDVPVVVLTVVDRPEVRQRLNELGTAQIVRKPVRPSALKEVVDGVLGGE
ncbi:MAG: response regulator [Chloroflexi bacterium]|jgi:CheY-like chemotaxis protein|nr:response regulator [Chloroflexota bacterium]